MRAEKNLRETTYSTINNKKSIIEIEDPVHVFSHSPILRRLEERIQLVRIDVVHVLDLREHLLDLKQRVGRAPEPHVLPARVGIAFAFPPVRATYGRFLLPIREEVSDVLVSRPYALDLRGRGRCAAVGGEGGMHGGRSGGGGGGGDEGGGDGGAGAGEEIAARGGGRGVDGRGGRRRDGGGRWQKMHSGGGECCDVGCHRGSENENDDDDLIDHGGEVKALVRQRMKNLRRNGMMVSPMLCVRSVPRA